jgi:hypothetical protein
MRSVSPGDGVERLLQAAAACSSLVIFTGSGVSATSGAASACTGQGPGLHDTCAASASPITTAAVADMLQAGAACGHAGLHATRACHPSTPRSPQRGWCHAVP